VPEAGCQVSATGYGVRDTGPAVRITLTVLPAASLVGVSTHKNSSVRLSLSPGVSPPEQCSLQSTLRVR
jgi:hypothetical protein